MGYKLQKYETVPMGEYIVECVEAKEEEGYYGTQVSYSLLITEGEHQGTTLKAWTSTNYSPKSKLYRYARAFYKGKELPDDYVLELEHLKGKTARASVLVKVKDDLTKFNKVDDLEPLDGWPKQTSEEKNPNTQPVHGEGTPF